jgi:hypothetical protein
MASIDIWGATFPLPRRPLAMDVYRLIMIRHCMLLGDCYSVPIETSLCDGVLTERAGTLIALECDHVMILGSERLKQGMQS